MAVICNTCGLPDDLCACGDLDKDSTHIIIRLETRRFKKKGTMIEGLDPKINNLESVAKEFKSKYACGGTAKEGYVFKLGAQGVGYYRDAWTEPPADITDVSLDRYAYLRMVEFPERALVHQAAPVPLCLEVLVPDPYWDLAHAAPRRRPRFARRRRRRKQLRRDGDACVPFELPPLDVGVMAADDSHRTCYDRDLPVNLSEYLLNEEVGVTWLLQLQREEPNERLAGHLTRL